MRVVFMGSPEFAVPSLRRVIEAHEVVLAVTQPDKPAGRGKKLTAPAVKIVAEEAGIEVFQPRSAKGPDMFERMRQTGADAAVVVAYGKILPPAVLEAFPRGCINVHGSLLPKYRGAAPIQWSIIRGESETGITIMRLDEGMDTGPMLSHRALAIEPSDTAGTLAERLSHLGAELLMDTLPDIAAGAAVEQAQDDEQATYAPMLGKADGRLSWSQSAEDVCNRARGVDPWPGATTTAGDATIKLFGCSLAQGRGQPGEIVAIDMGGATIACGVGAVQFADLQLPGKRRMAAADVARGRAIVPGLVLGS